MSVFTKIGVHICVCVLLEWLLLDCGGHSRSRRQARSDREPLRGLVIVRLEVDGVVPSLKARCHRNRIFTFGPQIRRGYPPNLSISFSGGKETKEDSPSNGERTGTKPSTEPHILWMSRNVVFGSTVFLSILRPPSPLERGPFP